MFCHRWLLVFLKREFSLSDILSLWETCWSCTASKNFHLFICVAIMAIYGEKAIEKNMNIDELMVYFNTLSHQMPKEILLSQARGYFNKFCKSKQVNCVLYEVMDSNFWGKKDSPILFCSVCQGFGFCTRTQYLTTKELPCWFFYYHFGATHIMTQWKTYLAKPARVIRLVRKAEEYSVQLPASEYCSYRYCS